MEQGYLLLILDPLQLMSAATPVAWQISGSKQSIVVVIYDLVIEDSTQGMDTTVPFTQPHRRLGRSVRHLSYCLQGLWSSATERCVKISFKIWRMSD